MFPLSSVDLKAEDSKWVEVGALIYLCMQVDDAYCNRQAIRDEMRNYWRYTAE